MNLDENNKRNKITFKSPSVVMFLKIFFPNFRTDVDRLKRHFVVVDAVINGGEGVLRCLRFIISLRILNIYLTHG